MKNSDRADPTPLFFLTSYRGALIYILDETTSTLTHTFEAPLAEVTLAHCRRLGRKKILFSSGGNLGAALAAYAVQAGTTAYSFNPLKNVPWLDAEIFSQPEICLVGVVPAERTREMMLLLRERVRKPLGYDPLVPKPGWRYEAFGRRAMVIRRFMRSEKKYFAAIVQTISAGFGLLAIFREMRKRRGPLPVCLGVQQEGNAPMYQRWSEDKKKPPPHLLIPTLFVRDPDRTFGTYPAVARMLSESGGALTTINAREFHRYISSEVLRLLASRGLKVTLDEKGVPVAKSGLTALAGAMKAIDLGVLRPGPVLVCMTDGVKPPWKPAKPAVVVRCPRDLDRLAKEFLEAP